MPSGLVLLSGGLDSATCLAVAQRDCEAVVALSFDYGQRHRVELGCAHHLAARAGVEHRIQPLPLTLRSALTDPSIAVPREASPAVPVTYVPARNIIFLSIAAAYAESMELDRVYIGVSSVDYSGYPDCRPAFIGLMQATLLVGQEHPPELHAPLLWLSKPETIRLGHELGVDYSLTHSCYDPDWAGAPCGACDSCRIREAAFAELA